MSAAVLPFTGKQVGPVSERSQAEQRADVRATRDARLIRDALDCGTTWEGAALMALIKALGKTQRAAVLGILDIRTIAGGDANAEQAAAMIRFETGTPQEIARVATLVVKMRGRGE